MSLSRVLDRGGRVKRRKKPWPGRARCSAYAAEVLALPHRFSRVRRAEPVGELVHEFVLPLTLCRSSNVYGRANRFAESAVRQKTLADMVAQLGPRPSAPLPGRPHVHAVRFSSIEPDDDAIVWAKHAIDCLIVSRITRLKSGKVRRRTGLGVIKEDNPAAIERAYWWEPAPPGAGFVLLRVYTGEQR